MPLSRVESEYSNFLFDHNCMEEESPEVSDAPPIILSPDNSFVTEPSEPSAPSKKET